MGNVKESRAAPALLVIRPPTRWAALNLGEVWDYRDLLLTFIRRDVALRYRQTSLGVAWVLLQPLLGAGVFTLVFGMIAKLPSGGVPYFVLSYSGLLGWNLFSNSLQRITLSLTGNAGLISKIYFPRLVIPVSSLGSILIDFLVALGLMIVMLFGYHITPGISVLMLPVAILVLLLMSLGLGLYLAALQVIYRDVGIIVPVLMNLILYASPVAYSMQIVPKQVRPFLAYNPLSGALETVRVSLLNTAPVPWALFAYSTCFAIASFIFGAFQFKRMEYRFADVI
jgi:homopolymeric O-antigen transport system permease protein